MIIHLVKKDFLLMKRYLLLTIGLAFGIPLFFLWRVPQLTGFTAFLVTVIYTAFIPLQSVSLAETRYPKTTALLCAAPYTRSAVVKARYLFFSIIFIFCYLAYRVLSLFVPQMKTISTLDTVLTLLIFTVFLGIYLPLQYKLGLEKMKYTLIIVLVGASGFAPLIINALGPDALDFGILTYLPLPLFYASLIAFILVVIALSLAASIKIFRSKEL